VSGPALELDGCATTEREKQDPLRIRAASDQLCDAVRERVRLARSRAGDHQQRAANGSVRPDAVLDGVPLLGIERIQICGLAVCEHESPPGKR
jgi:hypothetical protein